MEIQEFLEKKGEGLKRLGAIIWVLNHIESQLNAIITLFLADWSNPHGVQDKMTILNRALFDEKIFLNLESKRMLYLKIIKALGEVAKERNLAFEEEKWLKVARSISKVQEVRNDVAHKFLSFSDDGKQTSFTEAESLNILNSAIVELDHELIKADEISKELGKLIPDVSAEAKRILR